MAPASQIWRVFYFFYNFEVWTVNFVTVESLIPDMLQTKQLLLLLMLLITQENNQQIK